MAQLSISLTPAAELDEQLDQLAGRIHGHLVSFLTTANVESALERFAGAPTWRYETAAYRETVLRPALDLLARPGKKWRPLFAILFLESLGTNAKPYEELLSVTFELIHSGALIIDDIEDDSRLRRGDEAIHLRYGRDVAINAANLLYFLPMVALSEHELLDDSQQLEIFQLMARYFVRGHVGQATDIHRSRSLHREQLEAWLDEDVESTILQAYDDKTAAAIEATVEIAAVVRGSVPHNTRASCIEFARSLGVGFQILDDVNNFSRSPRWTKECGEDIVSGKLTYAILRAIRCSSPARSEELKTILCDRRRRCDPRVLRRAVVIVEESGALDRCRQEALDMFDRGWRLCTSTIPKSPSRTLLYRLCCRIFASLDSV